MHIWKHVLSYFGSAVVVEAIGLFIYPFVIKAGYPGGDLEGFTFELVLFNTLTFVASVMVALAISFRVASTTEPDEQFATQDKFWPGICAGAGFGLICVVGQALAWRFGLMDPNRPDPTAPYWLLANWVLLPIVCGEAMFWLVRVRKEKRRGFPVIQNKDVLDSSDERK